MNASQLSPPLVRGLLVAVALAAALLTHFFGNRPVEMFDVHSLSAAEMSETVRWLDEFYRSAEGLQRPSGLVRDGVVDYDAISGWLFQSYIQARADGASPEEARASIQRSIEESEEWRVKHP